MKERMRIKENGGKKEVVNKREKRSKKSNRRNAEENIQVDIRNVTTLEDIAEVLEKMHFRKAFHGVSEEDVWRKIKELDEMYRRIYDLQEQKYRTLLNARPRPKNEKSNNRRPPL